MKKMTLVVISIFVSPIYAEGLTGNELLNMCETGTDMQCERFIEGVVAGARAEQAIRIGTVRGIYEGLLTSQGTEGARRVVSQVPALCLRPDTAVTTIKQDVLNYARSMPERAKGSAGSLVYDALQATYGCNLQF